MTLRRCLPERFGGGVGQRGQFPLLREGERFGVDTVSQASRGGAIIENMAEMSIAAGAQDLGADHAVAAVFMGDDILVGYGLEEAGPAGAGVELVTRGEQRQPTADAGIDTMAFVVQQRTTERSLSALATSDFELLWCQLSAPLCVGLDDAGHLDGTDELALTVKDFNFHSRLLSDSEHLCAP